MHTYRHTHSSFSVFNKSEALLLDSLFIQYIILMSLNKYQLTVNNCMWIYCSFVIMEEFIVVLIIHFVYKKAPSELQNISSLYHTT
jgi:uncharacterized membrane protein SirB2